MLAYAISRSLDPGPMQVVVDFAAKDPAVPLDLLAVENGGVGLTCSNQHFGQLVHHTL